MKRSMIAGQAIGILVIFLCVNLAAQDMSDFVDSNVRVYLKNGSSLSGRVVSQSDQSILLELIYNKGRTSVRKTDIDSIEKTDFSRGDKRFVYQSPQAAGETRGGVITEKPVTEKKAIEMPAEAKKPAPASVQKSSSEPYSWENKEVTFNFDIFYRKADINFVKKVGEYAEQYYREITGKLGFFVQQWRGKIYIYDTKEDYLRDTRAPEWSIGLANYDTYSISSFVGAQGFMESVLPHEVGHIVFYVFMEGRGRDMPTCLHEGIAQYVERTESRRNFRTTVRVAVKKGTFIPLPGLFEVTSRQLLSMNEESVHVFYAEAVGVVDYLVAKHGSMNFAVFLQDLKEGNGFKPSMKWAFNYDTLSDMNDAWLKYLGP